MAFPHEIQQNWMLQNTKPQNSQIKAVRNDVETPNQH